MTLNTSKRLTLTRRHLLAAAASSTLGATPVVVGQAAQELSIDSGAIGLTRAELESIWQLDPDPVEVPGSPVWDQTFAIIGGQYAENYVTLFGDQQLVYYVEVNNLPPGGSELVNIIEEVEYLIPSDAELTEAYIAPPTPNGPTALHTFRYVSASLGEVHGGAVPSEILMTFHEQWGEVTDLALVTAVSIMCRQPTQ